MSEPHPVDEAHSVDVGALAEAVMVMLEATEKTNHSNTQALNQMVLAQRRVSAAPELMRQGVEQGVQESLKKLDAKENDLERRLAVIEQRGKSWFLAAWASALLLSGLLVGTSLLWLGPQIKQYADYQSSHPAVEQESLFGARIVQNEQGDKFIVFDEGVAIKQCSTPNCVGITH